MPDISQLSEIAQKKGPEAEKLAKETWDEITAVLQKKLEKAKELASKDH